MPAGLRQGDMSGLPEFSEELLKQTPSTVDSAFPAQHFAENVTGTVNGQGARLDVYQNNSNIATEYPWQGFGPPDIPFCLESTGMAEMYGVALYIHTCPAQLPRNYGATPRTTEFQGYYSKIGI